MPCERLRTQAKTGMRTRYSEQAEVDLPIRIAAYVGMDGIKRARPIYAE